MVGAGICWHTSRFGNSVGFFPKGPNFGLCSIDPGRLSTNVYRQDNLETNIDHMLAFMMFMLSKLLV